MERVLTESDRHCDEILDETQYFQAGRGLRSLFMILLELQPTNARVLWDKYKEMISEDYLRVVKENFRTLIIPDGEENSYAEQYAFYQIDGQLQHASTPERVEDLAQYNLPIAAINFDSHSDVPNRLLREEISYQTNLDNAEAAINQLNPD